DPTGTSMTEERRLVTALFADLSGFTPLSERLDAEELLEVIDPIITALSDIVGRYGGYVEKFAGDALLALFGAPVAHEDDATRALEVSIEMHRELARLRGTLGENGEGLTLHIGIASGRGIARMIGSQVRMDYAVLGDSVILAQRLESATPSGQTYISQSTYEIVQDRFDLEPVPPLTLKGKAEPVAAWRLLGSRRAADQRSGLAGRRHAPLLGRAREVAHLVGAIDRLAGGGGTEIVGIVGEPGVGKSRLVDEARRIAAEQEITWLDARCLSYGAALPYWPISDLLSRELGIAGDDSASSKLEALAGVKGLDAPDASSYIATLLGIPPPVELAEVEPEAFRRGLHDAVRAWLRARATSGGVILAIEDVHWADASTISLMADLAAPDAVGALGIWGTSRPPAPAWLATMVEVGQLDAAAIGELVDYVIGGVSAPELGAVIADRSAGNPFFAEEIVRSLSESGSLVNDRGGQWRLRETEDAAEVPATIEGVLSARIDALGPSTQSTLAVASVIGRRVDLRLLERVTNNPAALGQDLEALVGAGLLDPIDGGDDILQFHHALIADVAYGRLLRRRRRQLHQRTAEAAEALYGSGDESVEFLARHLYLGDGGARAVAYLERAAARAARLFANEEAIIHLRRAEKLAATDPSHDDVLLRVRLTLGDLQEVVGAYDDAEATYRRVLEGQPLVRAWRGLASVHRVRGRYAEALRTVEEAFADERLIGQDLRPLWLERGWSLTSTEAMGEAIAALEQGIVTEPDGVDPVAGELLIELARAESYAGRLDRALEHAAKALAIAQGNGDLRAETTVLRVLGLVQHDLGFLDQAAVSLRRDLELARRVGSVEAIGGALINLGLVERDRGEMDTAIACDREAIATFERVNHGAGRAIGYANLADKLRRAGELEEAEIFAHRAYDLADEIGHAMTRADAVQILGEISLARGAHDQAVALAEQSAELFLAADARPGAAEAHELAERAWRAAGDEERAAASAARVRELSEGEPG
ncbi:MAG TPA: adenylate/guanylate cyclase domain-containing protein, partial [Candidatus Limnocylindrales bacterium]|nr:adenylate/guanylate cyclase domain-containing protein [Candidatus Limnocylindrales bacterium]